MKDSASASAGGGAESASPGISTRKIHGGGGGFIPPVQDSKPPEQQKQVSQQADFRQRAIAAQQQREEQEQRARRESETRTSTERAVTKERVYSGNVGKTSKGVYEKGGAVIRETRTKTKDPIQSKAELDRLQKQQPGSAVVQTASGEYVLIKSTGLNLSNESTLAKVNENIEKEGGTGYSPTRVPQAGGGFLNLRKISDSVTTSEPVPPTEQPEQRGSFSNLDPDRPTKYTAIVGEGTVYAEQGALYQRSISDSMGGLTPGEKQYSQKELELFWKYHPRELARGISEGIYENQFIGKRGPDIIAYEKIGKKEEDQQVFPITYTTKEGKEVFTITGKSPEGEFTYAIPDREKEAYLSNLLLAGQQAGPVEANKIFGFPLESPQKGISDLELAKQAAVNIGV